MINNTSFVTVSFFYVRMLTFLKHVVRNWLPLIFIFYSIAGFSQTDGIPERPNPPRLVNNLSKEMPQFLSPQEESQLEKKLENFAAKTSNQIVVVIVDDLAGLEPNDFATRLGHKWGVGQAKSDNGVVILIKPTGGEGKRQIFISVGYGLEGAIPDLTTVRIRENEMTPYFKKGAYYTGLDKATDVIMALAIGEYNSDAYAKKNAKNSPILIILIIFVIVFILMRSSRGGKGGGGGGMTMGAAGWLLGSAMGGRGGGFGGGGGSSGGFGGFGGGGFGGGGSGGSW